MDVNGLKQMPLFASCSETDIEQLMHSPNKLRTYSEGTTVLPSGMPCQSLMLLTGGSVETRMGCIEEDISSHMKEVVVDRLVAPCILAPAFLFAADNIIPVEVIAITKVTLWQIDREAFFIFMQHHPKVLRTFLTMISNRTQFLSDKVRAFAIMGLRSRVLDYLAQHDHIINVAKAAEHLGVARPSLSRVLSEMVTSGVITKSDEGYHRKKLGIKKTIQ